MPIAANRFFRVAPVIVMALVLLLMASRVRGQADAVRTVTLTTQKVQDEGSVRIVMKFSEPVEVLPEMFADVTDVNHYEVRLRGGAGVHSFDRVTRPRKVGIEAPAPLAGREIDFGVSDFKLDMGPLLSYGEALTVDVTVSDSLKNLLNLDTRHIGPQRLVLGSTPGIRLFSSFFDIDVDLSRLEEGVDNGAVKFDATASLYFSTVAHVDLYTNGTTFMGRPDDTSKTRPEGSITFGVSSGLLASHVPVLDGLDVVARVEAENSDQTDTRVLVGGLAATVFPRLDRIVGYVAESMHSRAVNFPPRVKFFVDYADRSRNPARMLARDGWRWGGQVDWRLEFDEDFFAKVELRYTHFDKAPLSETDDRDFAHVDITGNYRLYKEVYFFVRYTDGELAPIYDSDNVVTTGFRYTLKRLR
jgi:hypothetical protein